MPDKTVTVMIATPFEDALVQQLPDVADRVLLEYRPDLLPTAVERAMSTP